MSEHSRIAEDLRNDLINSRRLIMPEILAKERELIQKKWFAYRFMTPLAATKLFAELYTQGLKRYVRAHRDIEESKKVTGLSRSIFDSPSGSLTQLWQARQRADEMGLPYELLIEFSFLFAGRRKWKSSPRPIQLFGSDKSAVAWRLELDKFLEDRMPLWISRMEQMAHYRLENYRGLDAQNDFREYLTTYMRKVEKRWPLLIGNFCKKDRFLPLEDALNIVPEDQRERVLKNVEWDLETGLLEPEPEEALPDIAMVPSCFGLSAACDLTSPECVACPLAARCLRLGKVVDRSVAEIYGAASPLQAERDRRRREKTRERVRLHRKKKKILESHTAGV